jgi:hypothetical protein
MKNRTLLFAASMLATVGLHGQSDNINVPDGNRELMHVKGDGVQIYTCTDAPEGRKWDKPVPRANLLDSNGAVIGTHFKGPTWKLNDGGSVQGQVDGRKRSPDCSVDWLRLIPKEGTSSGSLAKVTYIQRTETHAGVADATGCQNPADVGKTKEVPYTATYTFYVPN